MRSSARRSWCAPSSASVLAVDPVLEEASQSLRAGPFRTFLLITMPLIWPGICRRRAVRLHPLARRAEHGALPHRPRRHHPADRDLQLSAVPGRAARHRGGVRRAGRPHRRAGRRGRAPRRLAPHRPLPVLKRENPENNHASFAADPRQAEDGEHRDHLHRALQARLPQPVHPGRPPAQPERCTDGRRGVHAALHPGARGPEPDHGVPGSRPSAAQGGRGVPAGRRLRDRQPQGPARRLGRLDPRHAADETRRGRRRHRRRLSRFARDRAARRSRPITTVRPRRPT